MTVSVLGDAVNCLTMQHSWMSDKFRTTNHFIQLWGKTHVTHTMEQSP